MVRQEHSAGGVVVRPSPGGEGWEVALIRPHGRRVWALPKGHLDAGESHAACAAREVWEETGLTAEPWAPLGDIRYAYSFRGVRIAKRVDFYLFRATGGRLGVLAPAERVEVDETRWAALHEAAGLLGYEGERAVLARAVDFLRHHPVVPAEGAA